MTWNDAVRIAQSAIERCQPGQEQVIAGDLGVSRIGHTDIYRVHWIGKTVSDLTSDEAIGIIASILTPEHKRPL